MDAKRVEVVKVPGASLHCEITGSGPVLLLIPGAPADAAIFGFLGSLLADRYTVVTSDLRGLSRSVLDEGADQTQDVGLLAEDAHQILSTFSDGPAFVLGCSGGALVGLELAARYPEQVKTLVAHEPPAVQLLPEAEQWRTFYDELYDLYRSEGSGAAMGKFIAAVEGHSGPGVDESAVSHEPPPMPDFSQMPPEMLEMMGRMQGNVEFFFSQQLRTVTSFVPDFDALKSNQARVVVAGGARSKGQPAHNAAAVVANQLGTDLIEFPGDHQGFATDTVDFAQTLDQVLKGK